MITGTISPNALIGRQSVLPFYRHHCWGSVAPSATLLSSPLLPLVISVFNEVFRGDAKGLGKLAQRGKGDVSIGISKYLADRGIGYLATDVQLSHRYLLFRCNLFNLEPCSHIVILIIPSFYYQNTLTVVLKTESK